MGSDICPLKKVNQCLGIFHIIKLIGESHITQLGIDESMKSGVILTSSFSSSIVCVQLTNHHNHQKYSLHTLTLMETISFLIYK